MDKLDKLIENEVKFCEELQCEKNEHDLYIYKSINGAHSMNLPCILEHYKEWLIENGLVKKIE